VLVDAETNELVRDSESGFAIRMPYEIGGELLFRLENESSFVGYWKNSEATEKKFARDVFKKGDLYYRSGDSLKRSPDGKWSFLDRLGDTYRWHGENVSTAEVSECLGKYPGVVDANVYGVQVPHHDGRAGCAALLLDTSKGDYLDLDGLLRCGTPYGVTSLLLTSCRHARKDLPHYAIPLFLRIVSQAALNSNGLKQDKVKPRMEGVDPTKVQGDSLFVLKGNKYVPFTASDWHDLATAKARL
jgi:acyl-CoA synthetase (AMP-forming)/AMP-acid ligase II